jgi:D-alanyl-D-alanine carboxypeptidase
VSDAGVPGAIVAVQTKWGTWISAAGKADLATSAPMSADMQVRLAGSTKLFTAALIMQLAEENKISLTDIVDKWVPGQVWNGDLMTIGMLLNHTSGVHDHETTPEFADSLLWGPTIPWTAADVMWITDSYLPDFDPGTDFGFCNTNYYLLGMIAKAATGDTVENLIQSRFCAPLGLSRTALTTDGFKNEPYSRDYCWFGTPEYPTLTETSAWDLSFDWTSGAGVSTAQDMVTWIKALFGGQVVNSNSLTQMTTPQAPATTYGYGLEVEASDSRFGEKMYNQTGTNPGVYTRWLYYPNSGRIIFIFLNRCDKRFLSTDPPPQVDASQVADALLDGISSLLIQSQSQ